MSLLAPQSSRPVPAVARPPKGVPVDPVTGLGTRVRLMADLDALHTGVPAPTGANMLAAFALDGLSDYEREHGRALSGELSRRLAGRLVDALDGAGSAYAIGHGCFAVLARIGRGGSQAIVRACTGALGDVSAGISARALTTMTPIDMVDPADALLMLIRTGPVAGERVAEWRPAGGGARSGRTGNGAAVIGAGGRPPFFGPPGVRVGGLSPVLVDTG